MMFYPLPGIHSQPLYTSHPSSEGGQASLGASYSHLELHGAVRPACSKHTVLLKIRGAVPCWSAIQQHAEAERLSLQLLSPAALCLALPSVQQLLVPADSAASCRSPPPPRRSQPEHHSTILPPRLHSSRMAVMALLWVVLDPGKDPLQLPFLRPGM